MRYLIVDYIKRHPFTLGLVFLMGTCWGGAATGDLGFSPFVFLIVQMAVFSLMGLIFDLPKGYLRVLGMLPLSSQKMVTTLWLLGVCLGSCIAFVGFWLGALIHVLVGALWGEPWIPDARMFFLFIELFTATLMAGWSSLVISGDPTKRNWTRGLLGWVWALLFIWPLFMPKSWLQVLYDVSPYTVLPVILISGAVSYLLTPLVFTLGPSLSWPGGHPRPRKKKAVPVVFPSRRMVLLRTFFNPFLKSSLAMGISVWIGIMAVNGMIQDPEQQWHFVDPMMISMMMTMMFMFIFMISAGTAGIMRGLRVLPVSTRRMAWGMTLIPLEAWAGIGLSLLLLCLGLGEWASFQRLSPLLILYAGVSTLLLALMFYSERFLPFFVVAVITFPLVIILSQLEYSLLWSGIVCLSLAVVSLGLAYLLNLYSLRHKSSLYRPRYIFGQLASQAGRWQSGG